MPKDAHARKQIQLLTAELNKKSELIRRTNVLVFKQAAVTSLLIEKGLITNDEIEARVETFLHTNSQNPVGVSPESEGARTAEDHSGRGESGLLSGESDGDDSGKHVREEDPKPETSDQPTVVGDRGNGE